MNHPWATASATNNTLPRHAACLVCRKRKLKCNGAKPKCKECLLKGRECSYEDAMYKSQAQRIQDKVEALEVRINELLKTRGSTSRLQPSNEGSDAQVSNAVPSPAPSRPSSLPDPPSSWQPTLPSDEPTLEQTRKLLEVFILRQTQCDFRLHTDRVIASLHPEALEPIIPALLNSMLLLGCRFTEDSSLKYLESTLLERTKEQVEGNIDRALRGQSYNGVHHLQAMSMLSVYYHTKGRLLEGYYYSSSAVRFAVMLGIHQITSRIFGPQRPAGKLAKGFGEKWHPRDPIELGEAINVWWRCCALDCGGSALVGFLPLVDWRDVTTVWPRDLCDFETGELPDDDYSIAALLDPRLCHSPFGPSGDPLISLSAKATVLTAYSAELESERASNPMVSEEWWNRFDVCDKTIVRFKESLPSIQTARNMKERASLVSIHTTINCAIVQLHFAFASHEIALGAQGNPQVIQPDGSLGGASYLRYSRACYDAFIGATFVVDMDLTYLYPCTGASWECVESALTRGASNLRAVGRTHQAAGLEEQREVMVQCLERLTAIYPILSRQVKHLDGLRQRSTQTASR